MTDNVDRADLMQRIRKCLALGKSSNEHEAAAALAKARELMDAHSISTEDLAHAEVSEEAVNGTCTQRPPRWESYLCHTVRHALGVTVILGASQERIYIGVGAAPQIASYAFAVLFRKLKAARQQYVRTTLKRCSVARKRQRADIYCEAWALAVYDQVAALMPHKPVDAVIDSYIARRFGDLVEVKNRRASTKGGRISQDIWNGQEAGSKVELANAVAAGGPAGMLS